MEIMKLAKMLYLADYLYAKTFGHASGFMGGHARYDYGPVPVQFYPAFHSLTGEKILDREGNIVELKKDGNLSGLTEEELACLDSTLDEFKDKALGTVKNAAYRTEPMIEIQKEEEALGKGKLLWKEMDFSLINRHPLFSSDELDLSFMDDPEFKKNLA